MHIMMHIIGRACLFQSVHKTGAIHGQVQVNRLGRLEQPIKMLIQERPAPVIKPQPLPHAIAQHEAAIENTDRGLGPGF